jgi:hypothetical protein
VSLLLFVSEIVVVVGFSVVVVVTREIGGHDFLQNPQLP